MSFTLGFQAGFRQYENIIRLKSIAKLKQRRVVRKLAGNKKHSVEQKSAPKFDDVPSFCVSETQECINQVRDGGVGVMREVFTSAEVAALQHEIENKKPSCKQKVNRRKCRFEYVFSPADSPFASLAENEQIKTLMRSLLGTKYYLEKAGLIESLPGSNAQRWHMDIPHLFANRVHLPPMTINIFIPMCALTDENGPTELQVGTQRKAELANPKRYAKARCGPGSLVMYDPRVIHRGGSNQGKDARPLLYLTFSRIWYRDTVNP